jgi:hypothetical protein
LTNSLNREDLDETNGPDATTPASLIRQCMAVAVRHGYREDDVRIEVHRYDGLAGDAITQSDVDNVIAHLSQYQNIYIPNEGHLFPDQASGDEVIVALDNGNTDLWCCDGVGNTPSTIIQLTAESDSLDQIIVSTTLQIDRPLSGDEAAERDDVAPEGLVSREQRRYSAAHPANYHHSQFESLSGSTERALAMKEEARKNGEICFAHFSGFWKKDCSA